MSIIAVPKEAYGGLMGSAKLAVAVSASTITASVGSLFSLIPDDLGKLSALVGLLLSMTLCYTHLRKSYIHTMKTKLEMKMLEMKIDAHKKENDSCD